MVFCWTLHQIEVTVFTGIGCLASRAERTTKLIRCPWLQNKLHLLLINMLLITDIVVYLWLNTRPHLFCTRSNVARWSDAQALCVRAYCSRKGTPVRASEYKHNGSFYSICWMKRSLKWVFVRIGIYLMLYIKLLTQYWICIRFSNVHLLSECLSI